MIWTAAKMASSILRLMTGKASQSEAGATAIAIRHPDQAFPGWLSTLKQKGRLIA